MLIRSVDTMAALRSLVDYLRDLWRIDRTFVPCMLSPMARPYRDPTALSTTPHVDPATGDTVWVVEGLSTFGSRGPTDIVFRLGMEYRARAVVSDNGNVVWVLEVRRADENTEKGP